MKESTVRLAMANVENGAVAVERVHEIVSLYPEEDTLNATKLPVEELWPERGEIVFEDYSMRYS